VTVWLIQNDDGTVRRTVPYRLHVVQLGSTVSLTALAWITIT
jgi:hypothetical protein